MRRPISTLPLVLAGALFAAGPLAAQPAAPAAPPAEKVETSEDAEARATLDKVLKSHGAERAAAVETLIGLRPTPIPVLAGFLGRTRSSSDADRRAVLGAIGAELPDDQGKFRAPDRQTATDEATNDKFDWLAKVSALDGNTPGVADVIADIAAIRALAAAHEPGGATAILDFAFTPDGVAYRDECGRYLRRMAPWSLPALIVGSEKVGDLSKSRYANYQLERLDRQNPRKALADAPNEQLKVQVLDAFRTSLNREAVFVVLETVDDISPAVRKAARAAWMEYVAGRPPKPAPKEKLQLPGGKLTDKEMPLWLDSRELAGIALRRQLEALTKTKPDGRAKLSDLSKQLFDFYDQRRAAAMGVELDNAKQLDASGKHAEAAAICDRILVQVPELGRRAETAPIYNAHGEALAKDAKWQQAAAAFGKAAALAGEGELGAAALARHHEARGKVAEAKGESGAAEFAMAKEADADAEAQAAGPGGGGKRRGLLWAGIAIALGGLALLMVGWSQRKR
jgi:hypothetical protein